MKYLSHIPLHTLDLTPDEEAYLDADAQLLRYRGTHGRNISVWEAIGIFKDQLYTLCIDHMAANDNKPHWNDLLAMIRNDKKLDIQRAKAFPLYELFHRYGLDNIRGKYICPFHEDKTPSMSIHAKTNRFKCWACNASGDGIDFIIKTSGLSFPEAVNQLS